MSILPHPTQRPPRYLTQTEVRRFFASIDDPRDLALFAVMYHHGLRVGEVLLLQRGNVDLERERLFVRRLKGGTWSEQILFVDTAKLLRELMARTEGTDSDPLFPGRYGPLRRRQIQQRFVRYRERAGLPSRATTHSLRHSIATHLLDAGVSLEIVQDHLGHVSIRSTSIYARITDHHRAAVMRSLAQSQWIVQPGIHQPPQQQGGSDASPPAR